MARHDVERRAPERPGNDDAFMELFNDKDVTFDEMIDAFDRDEETPREESGRRIAQSAITQEMLGIDEEVKIKKTRKPVVKLDESRLTSAAGIPRLQKIAKTKLKFKGKGHEFSDVALLLRTYQLWLHDLYPRAKFHDGLTMLEKLGHTKSVQRLRCDWIAISKPGAQDNEGSSDDALEHADAHSNADLSDGADTTTLQGVNSEQQVQSNTKLSTTAETMPTASQNHPDEDELDALLAGEQETHADTNAEPVMTTAHAASFESKKPTNAEEDFSRDEDIMRELEMWDS